VINENSLRLGPPTRRAAPRGLESPIVTTPCPRPESAEEPAAGRRPGEAARRRSPLAMCGRWGASRRWGLGHLRGGKLGAAMGVGRGQTGRRRRRRRRGGGIEDEAVGFLINSFVGDRGLITVITIVCGRKLHDSARAAVGPCSHGWSLRRWIGRAVAGSGPSDSQVVGVVGLAAVASGVPPSTTSWPIGRNEPTTDRGSGLRTLSCCVATVEFASAHAHVSFC